MSKIKSFEPVEVEKMIDDGIVMIDVRREDEWKYTGVIENAHLLTFFDEFGSYNIEKWMDNFKNLVSSKNQKFVLICAHANRTKMIGNFLVEQGYINASDLLGGMAKWIGDGKKTIKYE